MGILLNGDGILRAFLHDSGGDVDKGAEQKNAILVGQNPALDMLERVGSAKLTATTFVYISTVSRQPRYWYSRYHTIQPFASTQSDLNHNWSTACLSTSHFRQQTNNSRPH